MVMVLKGDGRSRQCRRIKRRRRSLIDVIVDRLPWCTSNKTLLEGNQRQGGTRNSASLHHWKVDYLPGTGHSGVFFLSWNIHNDCISSLPAFGNLSICPSIHPSTSQSISPKRHPSLHLGCFPNLPRFFTALKGGLIDARHLFWFFSKQTVKIDFQSTQQASLKLLLV